MVLPGRRGASLPLARQLAPAIAPALLAHAALLALCGLVVLAAAQPLFTDDTWWHLSMGEAYLASGPWLDADPLLHTAEGPPAPAAWLTDVALAWIARVSGFTGLRVTHALLVLAILALAWSTLRRAGASPLFASLATNGFAALSAYRLFQLRPHLLTVLATLLLLRWLLVEAAPPSRTRIALSTGLFALWANLHGAFLLGLVLLGAAVGGLALSALLHPADRPRALPRARRLALALGLGLLATLANPQGAAQHLPYFTAGGETPDLEVVADEWAPLSPFRLPQPNLPPSALTWGGAWGLLLATPAALAWALRRSRRAAARGGPALDPALAAAAIVALAGMLSAVRLSWLAIVPLAFLGRTLAPAPSRPRAEARFAWGAAAAALALVPAFVWLGDWPMISKGLHPRSFGQPYALAKVDAHAVWWLRDTGLEGHLFNDYGEGNFLGYWLAPRLRVFVNGSLNVPREVMLARQQIRRRTPPPGESFPELLDRLDIDVFFGTGLPVLSRANRPEIHTTTHLEHTPGWILVFRNARTAVYLRDDARNRPNLTRVARHYREANVPFDPERGFDPDAVIHQARPWAVAHGLIPASWPQLEQRAGTLDPLQRGPAQERLAALYAGLGLYARAEALDRVRLQSDPDSVPAGRRLVWSRLHLRDVSGSLAAADALAANAPESDTLSALLVSAARRHAELPPAEAAALVAVLPLWTRAEARWALGGIAPAPPRPVRHDAPADVAGQREGANAAPAPASARESTGIAARSRAPRSH